MNIFILDNNVELCAQYHVDKHCIKMILETTQLLNNAVTANDPYYDPVYRLTHKNHPCSLWAKASLQNFDWLTNLGLALCSEYTYRYNKEHKCQLILESFKNGNSRRYFPDTEMTPFALCMPDQYKTSDPVESYRNYYKGDKAYIASWKNREIPNWWND